MLPVSRLSSTVFHPTKTHRPSSLHALILLYHSLTHSPQSPKIPLPFKDYSQSSTVAKSNSLISGLCREGKVFEARDVFDKMPQRDVVTWTTVITGYIKCGLIEEAKRLFDRDDAVKNVVTWTAMLSGYVRLNRIADAEKLFDAMPVKNVVSWNTMIDGYARNGDVDKVIEAFGKMPERNVVSWNTAINALSQCGRVDEARGLFDEMPKRDVISWTAMVAGLARNGRVDEAREVFERMPDRNVVSWNAMINGYAKNMRIGEAFDLFEKMPEKDLPSWNAMITGFIQNGNLTMAEKLFKEMPQKNVVSWTTMITGYVKEEENEAALKLFVKMMRDSRVKPNEGTFVNVLGACSDLAGLGEGQQVHQVISKTSHQNRPFVVSAIINMYSKCGNLGVARKMFDHVFANQRDLVCWNTMIAAYAHHGFGNEAIILFNELNALGYKPNDVTYVGLLSACSHAGMVDEGLKFFDELIRDKSIQLREDHYSCIVDLFCRAGRLNEAYNFIGQLGIKPSSFIWGALLSGCYIHGDPKMGALAAKELLEDESQNAGTYLLLSNIHASSGKWNEARKARMKMKEKRLKKQPGCSWIQAGNKVNVFLVGDKFHCQFNHINPVLHDLHVKMKKAGCVTNNDFIVAYEFTVK